MTPEQAYKILTEHTRHYVAKYDEEALEVAIEAVEKQIPKKPTPYPTYDGQCKCGVVFLDKSTKHCGNCGQALDWSDAQ